ncbi:MAG: alcohol dehydrogenase catalytic domain-containing protein [Chloroflexota bacterium]|nr:alcohol dehydrogenase catalytic domain-containing protein [Chloroflexota bacterium]
MSLTNIGTVKSAVMTAPNQVKAVEREIKSPGRGEVELQVGYVGICGSDLHAYLGGDTIFDFPIVFGHEFSARVLRCGPGIDHLPEGQWVGVAPLLACGDCPFCSAGHEHLCERRAIFGARTDGALRERLIMPAEVVYPLPAGVSPPEGVLGEPLAVAIHAVNRAGRDLAGAKVIISGAGAIGLLIALVVEQRGAEQILLLEIDEKRRNFARSLGFQITHPEEAPCATADCLFIAAGAPAAIAVIPDLLAPLGTAVVVGIISEAQLNWFHLLIKEGNVTTSRYFTLSDYQAGIRLLGAPGFKAKSLIQEQVAFSELFMDEGRQVMGRAQQVMRLLIKI